MHPSTSLFYDWEFVVFDLLHLFLPLASPRDFLMIICYVLSSDGQGDGYFAAVQGGAVQMSQNQDTMWNMKGAWLEEGRASDEIYCLLSHYYLSHSTII